MLHSNSNIDRARVLFPTAASLFRWFGVGSDMDSVQALSFLRKEPFEGCSVGHNGYNMGPMYTSLLLDQVARHSRGTPRRPTDVFLFTLLSLSGRWDEMRKIPVSTVLQELPIDVIALFVFNSMKGYMHLWCPGRDRFLLLRGISLPLLFYGRCTVRGANYFSSNGCYSWRFG